MIPLEERNRLQKQKERMKAKEEKKQAEDLRKQLQKQEQEKKAYNASICHFCAKNIPMASHEGLFYYCRFCPNEYCRDIYYHVESKGE